MVNSEELFTTVIEAAKRSGVARWIWSYNELNFGVSDVRRDYLRDELIKYPKVRRIDLTMRLRRRNDHDTGNTLP